MCTVFDEADLQAAFEELRQEYPLGGFALTSLYGKVPYYCEASVEIRAQIVVLAENRRAARNLAESAIINLHPSDHIDIYDDFTISYIRSIEMGDEKELERIGEEKPEIYASESERSKCCELPLKFENLLSLLQRLPQPRRPARNQKSFGFDDEASQGA